MQRDRRKRYSPTRHPVLLRRVLLVLCILAVLWLGDSCMMPQLLFSARGTMIFVPDPPLAAVVVVALCAYSAEELFIISQFWKICGFSRIVFSREGRKGEPAKTPDAKTGLLHKVLCSSPVHNLYTF